VRAAREFLRRQQQQQQQGPAPKPSSSGAPRPAHAPELDPEEDYFRRSAEFSAWLPAAKGVRFDGLPHDEARALFAEFCEAWNAGFAKTEAWLYDEREVERVAREKRTAHQWNFKAGALTAARGAAAASGPPPPPARAPPPRENDERLKKAREEEEAKMAGLKAMLAGGPIQIRKREPAPPG
jgi:hypothetical protein